MTVHMIARSKLSSSASSITINSIPQWNKDLHVVILGRTDRASNTKSTLAIRFNGDSSTNYSYGQWNVQDGQAGGTPVASLNFYNPTNVISATSIQSIAVSGATAAANTFGYGQLTIPDYASSSKHKMLHLMSMCNQGNWVSHGYEGSGLWRSTSPITSITIFDVNGANLVAGSMITVYGMG